jgi:hypothetical protein
MTQPSNQLQKQFSQSLKTILYQYVNPTQVDAYGNATFFSTYDEFFWDFKHFMQKDPTTDDLYANEEHDRRIETFRKAWYGTEPVPLTGNYLNKQTFLDYLQNHVMLKKEDFEQLRTLLQAVYTAHKLEQKHTGLTWREYSKLGSLDSRDMVAMALIAMVETFVKNDKNFLDIPPKLRVSARTEHGFFNTRLEPFDDEQKWDELLSQWRQVLTEFVRKGGHVTYTFRCDEKGVRGTPFALMKRLFEGGKNFKILFHEADAPIFSEDAPKPNLLEYAVIENVTGILAVATAMDHNKVNTGWIMKANPKSNGNDQLQILENLAARFEQGATTLWENKPLPAGKYPLLVASENGYEFELKRRGVNLFKCSALPDKTRPPTWRDSGSVYSKALLKQHPDLTLEQLNAYFELEQKRQDIFLDHVNNHHFRDLVSRYVLDALVDPALAEAYRLDRRLGFQLPARLKIERLEYWLQLLGENPKYEVRFLTLKMVVPTTNGLSGTYFCSSDPEQSDAVGFEVNLGLNETSNRMQHEYVRLNSKALSRSYRNAFNTAWDEIPAREQTREYVTNEIKKTIDKLKRQP